MKQDSSKVTTCLRRIAEQQIGDEVKLWHVISPKYQEKQTDRCAYFRPADKLTYALGFIGMLDLTTACEKANARSRRTNKKAC